MKRKTLKCFFMLLLGLVTVSCGDNDEGSVVIEETPADNTQYSYIRFGVFEALPNYSVQIDSVYLEKDSVENYDTLFKIGDNFINVNEIGFNKQTATFDNEGAYYTTVKTNTYNLDMTVHFDMTLTGTNKTQTTVRNVKYTIPAGTFKLKNKKTYDYYICIDKEVLSQNNLKL